MWTKWGDRRWINSRKLNDRPGDLWKSLILFGLLSLVSVGVNAQTWQEWTKQKKLQTSYKINQIVALNGYREVAKKGYELVRIGWNLVGDIQQGEFSMHQDYLASLSKVHPLVSDHPVAQRVVRFQQQILREVNLMDKFLSGSDELTSLEIEHFTRFNQIILQTSGRVVNQLEALLTAYSYEMEDGERMAAIDELELEIGRRYSSLKSYNERVRSLELNRSRVQSHIRQFNSLYDVR